jgi:uncharacterized protein with PIN domain
MVIDTSTLVALLGMQPEAARIAAAIESDATRLISAATVVEAAWSSNRAMGRPADANSIC